MTELDNILDYKPTPEEITKSFQVALEELEETPMELAKRMIELGDHRSFQAILRSLQRMSSGDTGVSGEMLVIVKMLVRRQRRRGKKYATLAWQRLTNGTVSAVEDAFTISLIPQTKGRWLVNLVHNKSGWNPSWPSWQDSLEAAKRKALTCLDDAYDHLEGVERGEW
jgi:hypothetical protein